MPFCSQMMTNNTDKNYNQECGVCDQMAALLRNVLVICPCKASDCIGGFTSNVIHKDYLRFIQLSLLSLIVDSGCHLPNRARYSFLNFSLKYFPDHTEWEDFTEQHWTSMNLHLDL